MRKAGLWLVGVMVAGISLSGCASAARSISKEIISQMGEDKDRKNDSDKGEDSGAKDSDKEELEPGKEHSDTFADGVPGDGEDLGKDSQDGTSGSFSGSYDQFIQKKLEPLLGTAKNSQFSYGFEQVRYEGSDSGFASPTMGTLENGIVSTYRRDLNKDGRDELLVAYVEGSRQSGDGRNHFCLGVYGDLGNGITELGKIAFDDCFSGYNGENYLFGLKDVGSKQLIYAGGSGLVWTWADGVSPEIRLFQMEGSQIKEIYNVSTSGSDNSWMEGWRRELQGFGFTLAYPQWSECDLYGEPGFEVLAYGECYTQGAEMTNLFGSDYQQYLVEHASILGSIYGPDSQKVMQMNQSMQAYAGGNVPSYGQQGGTYAGGNADYHAGEYILPNSNTAYLTRSDLYGLNENQLRLARNEIYARHGRKFKTKEIQDYFNSKSWYVGTVASDAFNDSCLNNYEKENIRLIQSMEK